MDIIKYLILFDNNNESWRHQELWDPDTKEFISGVSDISESPEDAIIGRALLDCDDAANFIKLGFKYKEQGYDCLEIVTVIVPGDDMDEFIDGYLEGWKLAHKRN